MENKDVSTHAGEMTPILSESTTALLRKSLGPMQVQLISLGGIIGSAYFLGVGAILSDNGPTAILAFLLGGLIVWLVSMAMGELSVGMPREGSFVSQSRELIGRPWAAAIGWSYWLNWCAYIPSEMVAGGLILNHSYPQISVMAWASVFACVITVVNLVQVKNFGTFESVLAILKIFAILLFSLIAVGIIFGWFGTAPPPATDLIKSSSHKGVLDILSTMVLVLVNFQGTELIALSAAETKDPQLTIPRAARSIAVRIVTLYVIPLSLLILIFPNGIASVENSVFTQALSQNGFTAVAKFFQFVIVTAALSCANSGLYGAVRSLYGLGKEKLAPNWVTQLNAEGVPAPATWLTIIVCWAFLPLYIFFEGSTFYTWLLSVSGFTGAICWISIAWCQIKLRRQLAAGSTPSGAKPLYQMPGYPFLSWLSIGLQLICIVTVAFHPTLRTSLILGIPAVLIPAIVCWIADSRRRRLTIPRPE